MYNILRVNDKKFKDKGHITQAVNHNLRLHIDEHLKERIYPEKSKQNKLVFNPLGFNAINGGSDFQEKLFKHYEDLGIKAKKDNVYMLEFIISASPEFFETSTPQTIAAWEASQLEFLKEQFGDNLKLVVEHNDESTKHYHAFVSTEIKSVKKYKNQKGEFFKETWSLNAKRFDPEFLVKLHDAHAAKNDRFGLLRGVEGSTAEHVTLKDYTKRLNRVLSRNYGEMIADKLDRFFAVKSNMLGYIATDKAKKVLVPFLTELKSDLECLKFHIKDKKKRNKLLEEEAKRLKSKEKQMDKLLDDATQALKSKNLKIDDLIAENEVLKKSEVDLTEKNENLSADVVNYQNQIKALKKKLEFK
jgi:hypothetical protein